MVGKITFSFEGGAELDATLKAISHDIGDEVAGEAVVEGAEVVSLAAKRLVRPGPSGNMERSIGTKLLPALPASRTALVGPRRISYPDARRKDGYDHPAVRAPFLEFGTKRSRAFPFMRPALDMSRTAILKKMTDVFRVGLKAAAMNRGKP